MSYERALDVAATCVGRAFVYACAVMLIFAAVLFMFTTVVFMIFAVFYVLVRGAFTS